jgi:heterotetrameric sarcosine oxidase gamma subunit
MSRLPLTPRSGLEQLLVANRQVAQDGPAGVTLALRSGPALATVSVRRNQMDALAERVREVFGLRLVHAPRCVIAGPIAFLWAGPGQWLAMGDGEDGPTFEQRLRSTLGNLASVNDQSDCHTIFRIGGRRARDALAKGVAIDLHPSVFCAGDAALTTVAHIGAHFWQVDETPIYEFIISRSFAAAFCDWLLASAAEFGVVVQGDDQLS